MYYNILKLKHILQEYKVLYLSIYLSIYVCVCVCVCVCACVYYISRYILSIHDHNSYYICSYLSIYLPIYLSNFHNTTCESTCDTLSSSAANQSDNTVSVAHGGTATPGTTKQLLPGKKNCYLSIDLFIFGGARGVMVIIAGYGHGDTSSNPGPD